MGFLDYLPAILNNLWLYVILFLIVVTFVIFVHEMGHYLAARIAGVRPELFSIGFGRELVGRTDCKGTRWSLRLYPFGGYVRMFGEQEGPEIEALTADEQRKAYCRKSPLVRALIAAAGPFANFLFGLTLLACVYMGIGRPAPEPYIAALEVDGPAYAAGLKIGDRFYAFDDVKLETIDQAKALLHDKIGIPVKVDVIRDGKMLTVTAKPKRLEERDSYDRPTERGTLAAIYPNYGLDIREMHSVAGQDTKDNPDRARKILLKNDGKDVVINFGRKRPADYLIHVRGELNAALKDPTHKDYNSLTLGKRPMESIKRASVVQAFRESADLDVRTVNQTLGVIYQIVLGTKKTNELGGVIKISSMTADMAKQGTIIFFTFVALLSVNIGLVNLLPVPMLDGGHIMFCVAEAIKGEPVSVIARAYTYGFGLIFLLLTIFIINLNDLLALLKVG